MNDQVKRKRRSPVLGTLKLIAKSVVLSVFVHAALKKAGIVLPDMSRRESTCDLCGLPLSECARQSTERERTKKMWRDHE